MQFRLLLSLEMIQIWMFLQSGSIIRIFFCTGVPKDLDWVSLSLYCPKHSISCAKCRPFLIKLLILFFWFLGSSYGITHGNFRPRWLNLHKHWLSSPGTWPEQVESSQSPSMHLLEFRSYGHQAMEAETGSKTSQSALSICYNGCSVCLELGSISESHQVLPAQSCREQRLIAPVQGADPCRKTEPCIFSCRVWASLASLLDSQKENMYLEAGNPIPSAAGGWAGRMHEEGEWQGEKEVTSPLAVLLNPHLSFITLLPYSWHLIMEAHRRPGLLNPRAKVNFCH